MRIKSFLFLLLLFFSVSFLPAASVRMINDSPFPLSATVLSASGTVMGRQSLQPQEQALWQNSDVDVTGISQSPFTVIFYCTTGEVFGTISQVQTSAMVTASASSGPHFCKPKNDKKGKEEQKKSDLQYQPHPINPDQWKKQDRY